MKVLLAFNLLLESNEKRLQCETYNELMYDGIAYCKSEKCQTTSSEEQNKSDQVVSHIHLRADKQFVGSLIARVEPELSGTRSERHAKTIESAQEEVLTCIGIYLFDRYNRMYQTIKLEHQLWKLLFTLSIHTMRKTFETEYERLQGVSNLDLVCAELEKLEQSRNLRDTIKKEKKKEQRKLKQQQQQQQREIQQQIKIVEQEEQRKLNELQRNESKSNSPVNKKKTKSNKNSSTAKKLNSLANSSVNNSSNCLCDLCENTNVPHTSEADLNEPNGKPMKKIVNFCLCDYLKLEECLCNETNSQIDESGSGFMFITEEEKQEYFANKAMYLLKRKNQREILFEKYKQMKLNANFKLKPRYLN
jgi:hypothetical protein